MDLIKKICPHRYVQENKIISSFPKVDLVTNLFPKSTRLIGVDGYFLGQINESGHWSGLLGRLERFEAESCFHPIPLDIKNPPGKLVLL